MKTTFRASFKRDLKRVRDDHILGAVRQAIADTESAAKWNDVPNIKKIKGASNAFQIRISDYRVGLFIEGDVAEFVRVLARPDIYRKFPAK